MTLDVKADPRSAYYRFSQERLVMEVVSFRAIEEGEEITMSCKSLLVQLFQVLAGDADNR